ncbi:dockerin type I repeat-containing protein [uncultured Ruminococcus sp.]|uniref:dockerin type I repeat-containing protein n=1 Tax=uncultured Ruminococcus sp. TaxID=165186 RepID=UPI0025E0DC80|nr:dockerin type I repeat-containing protein [uncultured Ruminococcus sp.]
MKRRKLFSALTSAAICLSLLSGQTATQVTAAGTATGDVNGDGAFNVSDVVLLQKWLLAVPDTHLENWRAANFCEDERLDVFDLCLMKRELLGQIVPPITDGKLYQQIGLVDPYADVVAYQGLLPEGWTVQMQSGWGLINPLPGQEIVSFVSPDGRASISIASPQIYEEASDRGYGANVSDFITFVPYMNASSYIDYYVQNSYVNAVGLGDVDTADQQSGIDAFTEVYATNGINTALQYCRYPITGYGSEGTVARRQYQLGGGYGEFSCAVSAYQYSYTKVMLNITETWWQLLNSVAYTAADKEAFEQYYEDYELIVANGYFTAGLVSAEAYVIQQIYNTVTEQRTEERIRELTGGYSTSGTEITSSDMETMETQDLIMQAWDDYIKDQDTYSLSDGSTLHVPTSVDTVAQNGDSVYFGTTGGVPLGYDILTAN